MKIFVENGQKHIEDVYLFCLQKLNTLYKINTKMGALLRIHSLIDPTVLYWVPVTCLQQTVKPNIECGTKSLGCRNLTAILLSTLLSVPKLLVPWFSHLQNGANSVLLSIALSWQGLNVLLLHKLLHVTCLEMRMACYKHQWSPSYYIIQHALPRSDRFLRWNF